MKHRHILSLVAMIIASAAAAQAQTVAAWSFENDPIAVNNTPAPSTGTGTAGSIGMATYATPNVGVTTDDVLAGKSSDTGNNGVANTSRTWRVRGQAGSNGAANGWSSLAPIGTQGAQFNVSTVGYTGINVSFDWYATTQGEANLELAYTVNGGATYNNLAITLSGSDAGLQVLSNNGADANTVTGSYVSDNILNNASGGQDWFTGLTATFTDPLAANNPNFGIEIVNASTGADDISTAGTALNNNSGNWRFDNIIVSGTAVPEPSSLALIGLGVAGLAAYRKARKV